MKKLILLAVVAVLFSARAMAFDNQHSYYGLTVNFNYNFINEGGEYHQTFGNTFPMYGMDLGGYFQQQLYKRFVLVSGLKYSFTFFTESKKVNIEGFSGDARNMIFNHALTIPVKFGYTGDLPRNWTYTVFAGPSLQFDVATIQKLTNSDGDYVKCDMVNGKSSTNLVGGKSYSDEAFKELGCFDVPLGLGVTFKHKYVGIKFEYEYGLINRYKGSNIGELSDAKWNSHQISLGAVFTF